MTNILLFLVLGLFSFASAKELTIIYTNNTNGILKSCTCPGNPYGSLAERLTVVKKLRNTFKNTVLVDAGDTFSPYKEDLRNRYVLLALEKFNYNAIGIGDQEFINGIKYFKDKTKDVKLPLSSSNIFDEKGMSIANPYATLEIEGIKIVIISAISKNTFMFHEKQYTSEFMVLEQKEIIGKIHENFRNSFFILLFHANDSEIEKLADEIKDISVIVSGHDQTLLKQPKKVKDTLIVQAGKNGEHVGRLSLRLDENNKVVSYENEVIELKSPVAEDKEITVLVSEYEKEYAIKNWKCKPTADKLEHSLSCKACHESQYEQWAKTKHVSAFEHFKGTERENNPSCLKCHTTPSISMKPKMMANVDCIACHVTETVSIPPHKRFPKIKEEVCTPCHTKAESPDFNYEKYYQKIKH